MIETYKDKVITTTNLLFFVFGLLSCIQLTLIGQLFVAEILFVPLFLFYFFFRFGSLWQLNMFRILSVLCILMLMGYVVSDLFRGVSQENYLRGWARVIFLFIDFVVLTAAAVINRYSFLFFISGIATGNLFQGLQQGIDPGSWKTHLGHSLNFLFLVFESYVLPFISGISGMALGGLSILFDSRSLGAALLLAVASLWFKRKYPGASFPVSKGSFSIGIKILLALMVLIAAYGNPNEEQSKRRSESNVGRLVSTQAGLVAISKSPLIGYGSWGDSKDLAKAQRNFLTEKFREMNKDRRIKLFVTEKTRELPHSMILRSWVEGGIFSFFFFGFLAFSCIHFFFKCLFSRGYDRFTALFFYILILTFWHIMQSPFAGKHRFTLAVCMAVLCFMTRDEKVTAMQKTGFAC